MSALILLFLLFFLQFVYLPIGTSFFEGSKVIVFELATLILVLRQIFSKTGLRITQFEPKHLLLLFGIFLIAGINLIHYPTQTVLLGNTFRLQGTLLLMTLLFFSLASSRISIEHKLLPKIALFVLTIQAFFAVILIGFGTDRPIGTIGEPNALGASVLFFWPFVYFITHTQKNSNWSMRILGLLLVCVLIILSGSRSAVIAFGVQLAFLLVQKFWSKKLWVPVTVALALLVVSYLFPLLSKADLYENRGEIWQSALTAGSEHALWGVGFGNSEYMLHNAAIKLNNHLPGYYVDSAHNIFLDWYIQAGIVGLLLFVILLVRTFRVLIREKKMREIVILLGLMGALSFNPASVVSLVGLWWVIGQTNKP